jgi:hypothetical protein
MSGDITPFPVYAFTAFAETKSPVLSIIFSQICPKSKDILIEVPAN